MGRMKRRWNAWLNGKSEAYAVVEATILFPIIMMVFAGLFLLSVYLPTRTILQRGTQYAAEGIATARSDTWVAFEADGYKWLNDARNVYAVLFGSADDADAELVVQKSTANGLMLRQGDMSVTCQINNYIIYQEVVVTAVDTVHVPIDLSFVKFPNTIDLTTSSTAVVQNGDEFVRNMDIAADFVKYLDQRFQISTSEAFVRVKEVIGKLTTFLHGKG